MTSWRHHGGVDVRCVRVLGFFSGELLLKVNMDSAAVCGKNMKNVIEPRGLKRVKCPDRRGDIMFASPRWVDTDYTCPGETNEPQPVPQRGLRSGAVGRLQIHRGVKRFVFIYSTKAALTIYGKSEAVHANIHMIKHLTDEICSSLVTLTKTYKMKEKKESRR